MSICFYAIGGKISAVAGERPLLNFFMQAQKLNALSVSGLLTLVLVLNLGALGLSQIPRLLSGELLGCTGVQPSLPQLALPIGISFYTFSSSAAI